MGRLIILLAVGFVGCYAWQQIQKLPPEKRKKTLLNMLLWGFLGAAVLLVITGRTHWIVAAVAALIPLLKGLLGLAIRAFPLLQQWLKTSGHTTPGRPSGNTQLTITEAYQLLGLKVGASREDVVQAHKRLIQKLHPDRGGNDYLAAKLNEARDLLLEQIT